MKGPVVSEEGGEGRAPCSRECLSPRTRDAKGHEEESQGAVDRGAVKVKGLRVGVEDLLATKAVVSK